MSTSIVEAASPARQSLVPLGLLALTAGISTAIADPFLALFLTTAVRASPLRVTAFLIATAVASAVMASAIARLSDRLPIRRRLLIVTSVAGLISMGLTAFVRDYSVLLLVTATVSATATALFPQVFAYARELSSLGRADRAALRTSSLRTIFSVAWVAGPPLATVMLEIGGFAYLYGLAAVMYAGAALVAVCWLDEIPLQHAVTFQARPPDPDQNGDRPRKDAAEKNFVHGIHIPAIQTSRRTIFLTATAFTMLQCPMLLSLQAMPLFVSADLHADAHNAALLISLCAAVEIPLMLGLGVLSTRFNVHALLLIGIGSGVAYYALATLSTTIWMLAMAQPVNALFTAAVAGLGISYIQDLLPRWPGRGATLYTNTFTMGAILTAPLFGLAQQFGFRLAYGMSTGLCLAGFVILLVTGHPGRAGRPRPQLHHDRLP
jgi:MFS transporter, SET family, sugar efflux transporter